MKRIVGLRTGLVVFVVNTAWAQQPQPTQPQPVQPQPAAQPLPVQPQPQPAQPAAVGCVRDTDCAGHWVCRQGVCQDPVMMSEGSATSPGSGSAGWALGGAIAGFVSVAPIVGLGAASAATSDEQLPALPLGGVTTLFIAVMAPVTFGAGKSARRAGFVRGSVGLRVGGWISYGLSLVNAFALIGLGAAELEVMPWQIGLTTGIGALSVIFFATDALISRRQALSSVGALEGRHVASLAPVLAPVIGPDGAAGGIVGVGGTF